MNIIVKGAKTLDEYKSKRAAIRKLALQLSAQWGFCVPETAWIDGADLHVVYPDGSQWKFTSSGSERER